MVYGFPPDLLTKVVFNCLKSLQVKVFMVFGLSQPKKLVVNAFEANANIILSVNQGFYLVHAKAKTAIISAKLPTCLLSNLVVKKTFEISNNTTRPRLRVFYKRLYSVILPL